MRFRAIFDISTFHAVNHAIDSEMASGDDAVSFVTLHIFQNYEEIPAICQKNRSYICIHL